MRASAFVIKTVGLEGKFLSFAEIPESDERRRNFRRSQSSLLSLRSATANSPRRPYDVFDWFNTRHVFESGIFFSEPI